MRPARAAVAALAVVVIGACNFESSFHLDTRVDPGAPGDRFMSACQASAVTLCDFEARCYSYDYKRRWVDRAECEDRRTLGCQLGASAPGVTYDESTILACAYPADFPCPSDPGYAEAQAAANAKCHVSPGALAQGEACTSKSACATDFCFPDFSKGGRCGVCTPPPCGGGCDAGQICILEEPSMSSMCMSVGDVGAPCSAAPQCATYLCEGGKCAAPHKLGDPCDPSTGSCADEGSYCDFTTKVCRLFALAKSDEPCGELASGFTLCGGGGTCPRPLSGANSVCIPPAGDGSLCYPEQGLDCLYPAVCVDGFCRFHDSGCSSP